MKLYKHFWLFIFLSSVLSISSGQIPIKQPEKKCPVRTLNYETGLLNNATLFVLTDAHGFTWISTKTGLQRFNGNKLETISPVIDNDTLNINQPVYLFNLRNGYMWISYKNFIIEYNPYQNIFRKITRLEPSANNGFDIMPLKETAEGVWCMQKKKGILIYSTEGKIVQAFSNYETSITDTIFSSENILYKNIIAVNTDYIFISATKSDILKINTTIKTFGFLHSKSSYRMCLACFNNTLFEIADDKLLLIDAKNNITRKTVSIDNLKDQPIDVNELSIDAKGHLFISLSNHLYEFDTAGNYKNEITDLNRNAVLTAGFIHRIYADKFGRIWLLGNDNVVLIQNQAIPFTHFIYPQSKNNFIRSIYYDEHENLLFAGCLSGGLQLYDTLGNALWKAPLTTKWVNNVLAIEKLMPDKYLIVTFGHGWYTFTLSTKQFRPFDISAAVSTILEPNLVRFTNNIQRLDDNTIVVATYKNIFRCVFYKTSIKYAEPLLPVTNEFQNEIDCFFYTRDKTLWTGTSSGVLYKLDKNHHVTTYHIPGNYMVRTITEDALHNIWVGTDKGLCVYSQEGKFLKEITSETGLINDCIYSLLPVTNSSSVFASSNYGLSYISLQGTINNYSKELSLQDLEFNTASCVKTQTGKMYFGGVDGVTSFYPGSLSVVKDTPGIYITRLVINDIPCNFSSSIRKGDSILLDYSNNHLQLDITALGLLNPDEYIYKYRLKGFQNQWEVTHHPDNINYILPPGQYMLQIICSPNLSANIFFKKNIIIIISYPWWQTWWFIILAILFSIAFIAFIVHLYNRNKYNQKIKLLQAKNEIQMEKERISRDLHDNLGAQANSLLHGTEQLQNLNTSESMLVNNLNTTARDMMHSLRETIWVMKHNDAKASEIWFRIINFSKQLSVFYNEIKITTEGEFPAQFIYSSEKSLHIVLIVQEALNNAVKHAEAKNIYVISRIEKQEWIIEIKDNGKGITKNEQYPGSGGNGLNNMKERSFLAAISLSIQSDNNNGTSVILKILPAENHPN
ncbi:MAG TPA: ATP-binding protein [Chitinophagaceae bacterium]|nr:ATP-binding protein [Chitinophagaceae bacterium]